MTMKIWTISDLHIRNKDAVALLKPDRFPEADLCVIAGDVCDSMHLAVNWAGKVIRPRMPVVFVPGNHEFYDTSIDTGRKDAELIARAVGVTLLDDSSAVIGGVRFLGGTLWTDYAIYESTGLSVGEAMAAAKSGIADYSNIYLTGHVIGGVIPRLVKPRDLHALHMKTCEKIEGILKMPFDGPTVVVTHHAPHPLSVHPQFDGDPTTPAFVSDLSGMIRTYRPEVWIHGHVHNAFDYKDGPTRIVCNPRGYGPGGEDFDFMKVIEVR